MFLIVLGVMHQRVKTVDLMSKTHRLVTLTKSSHPGVFCKKLFLEIARNSQKKAYATVSFLTKLQASACEFCEISMKPFLSENLWPLEWRSLRQQLAAPIPLLL